MTEDANLKIVCKTGSSRNTKQHAVECVLIHTMVKGCQLTIKYTAGIRRELRDQFIAARNRKHPWSPQESVHTVREIEHHDVESPGIVPPKIHDKGPRKGTKNPLITLQEANEAYMVEVIAVSHYLKQQQIPWRYSTGLPQWQGKEIVYSRYSPTCTWPWIWLKWPKVGFHMVQWRKSNNWSRYLGLRSEMKRFGVLRFWRITMWRLQ